MAKIAPLRAVRYDQKKVTMEDVVTPPYDVIDLQAQNAFLQKNPYSMIKLDLSKNIDKDADGDKRYQNARNTFDEWLREGVLKRDSKASFYLYYTDYTLPSGKTFTRKGLICLVGVSEFSEGIVKPHEKFFRGVVSDRLKLIDTCQAQFSPIFSLYEDKRGEVIAKLEAVREPEPVCAATDQDGCRHTVWAVSDSAVICEVEKFFKDKSLYIADGHHRYNTALQLRDLRAERSGAPVAADSPYDFTMMYLCAMEDPGLSVLPTHRLVHIPYDIELDSLLRRMEESFAVTEITAGSREILVEEVLARMDESRGATTFGFYHPGEDRCFLLTLKEGVMEAACSGKQPETLQDLDVVVLSEIIVHGILELPHERCEEENLIDYYSDPDEALDAAVKESAGGSERIPALFFMNPTKVVQVKNVADESLIMPHKSTYFYPKLLTGLVINQLVEEEKIGG